MTPQQHDRLLEKIIKLETEKPVLIVGKYISSLPDGSDRHYCGVGWLAHEDGMTNLQLREAQNRCHAGTSYGIHHAVADWYGLSTTQVGEILRKNDHSGANPIEIAQLLRTYLA